MKIGAIADSFRKPLCEAIKQISALKLSGVQMYADNANLNIGMTATQIKEIGKMIDGEGIKVSALCGDIGCDMYYTKDRAAIDKEKRIMEIAQELGTNIVTTHIGVVPNDRNCRQYESMHEVCRELAEFADSVNGHFAVETGPEKADLLKEFLDGLNSTGVSVNLDPANLVMCAGDDPVKAVHTLKDYIVHTHAKDGIQLKQVDTRTLYCARYYDLPQGDWKSSIAEKPLGKGNVDWDNYLKALKDIGYTGYLVIERECGDTPAKDISAAADFLREQLSKL
ncbi:sugar phosphate isomerase/epimerase family protein [Anaerocaecibacter muris]|uniref:sugar phosphate isomerase/epimerase family protein n=1 Tax=Anaerocaecibacter muris TaxID=2941513 RepID=UPI00203BA03E|nr:sugar phosphate isomerase/epimerase family protein [Anaerocaecibacter muris]